MSEKGTNNSQVSSGSNEYFHSIPSEPFWNIGFFPSGAGIILLITKNRCFWYCILLWVAVTTISMVSICEFSPPRDGSD